jgi:hypothetical protein
MRKPRWLLIALLWRSARSDDAIPPTTTADPPPPPVRSPPRSKTAKLRDAAAAYGRALEHLRDGTLAAAAGGGGGSSAHADDDDDGDARMLSREVELWTGLCEVISR